MKAFRNLAGTVIEIEVDVDPNGDPILPPDTTTDPRPEAQEGHYVTVVDRSWVQIPIPQTVISFETKKQQKMEQFRKYRAKYIDGTVTHAGLEFDADELTRGRLVQVLFTHQTTGYLPPAWIAADNTPYPLNAVEDLQAIANAVQQAFAQRFFEMDAMRRQILDAVDEAALDAVVIPQESFLPL